MRRTIQPGREFDNDRGSTDTRRMEQENRSSSLYNEDLAPTRPDQRTWNLWHIAALWVGMAVCVPTYTLASGLLSQGLSWAAAIGIILVGNLIVLIPMALNAHPGAAYGIPFPVLARASFGTRGANVPALLRALVACGWFGIQTWFGGLAIYQLGLAIWPGLAESPDLGAFLGLNAAQLVCFFIFWSLNMWLVVRGMESIRWLEAWSAPVLIAVGIGLLVWGISAGGSLGRVLDHSGELGRAPLAATVTEGEEAVLTISPVLIDGEPRHITEYRVAITQADDAKGLLEKAEWRPYTGPEMRVPAIGAVADSVLKVAAQLRSDAAPKGTAILMAETKVLPRREPGAPPPAPAPAKSYFWAVVLPALTAMVGYWATLSLNIPDFTRFARSQRDQLLGQSIGLPPTMAFYSFIGVVATAAGVVALPDVLTSADAPWDPVSLIGRFDNPLVLGITMFALSIATLTTNIAANVVSPANDFANLAPKYISFRTGGIITGVLGALMMPWKLLATAGSYLFTWLIGYSALLGPIGGILIADYFICRKRDRKSVV